MANLLKVILPILLVGLASMFGITLEPDNTLVANFATLVASVPVGVQFAVFAALSILVMLPHIAALTPWTWDDWTIQHKGKATALLAKVWNTLAGNYGKAKNNGSSG